MESTKKDINLYNQFLKYSYSELKELFNQAKTKEEQDFYMSMSNLVLQREQRRVIREI
ncbi:hypothetical protein [Clostridium botulinum]|uniref:hypothetical protein n=1 Tax=Clostridium botulinum TaxID=1491 RepID=UPI001C9A6194|nr:hypothetical protein [Clostridium botulinum]MBY6809367.1 hypothetical protein [Clostridium botulinum]MBY6822809.1 hypothetical protein [Clostridium botulinum]MBY6833421.1 hypothetical protein [Clostridium botulinum]MBY6971482.1 hypothetical protein [Clostridium botulinum]HBJ1649201.1 hypothetical protein [Clostridium botulinum]